MTATIVHRGPESGGRYLDDGVGLGARRLRIVDLHRGDQPIANERGTLTVVFNGEIYNHPALRVDLERLGHRFRTRSDTEVVVHAYEEWGPGCLERFRGMFAIAIWDRVDESLFLAVDRFGIKPLYVARRDDGLVFGSEPAAIFASKRIGRALDERSLAEYLALGYVSPPDSIFDGVGKLEPATYLRWRRGGETEVERYWLPPTEAPVTSADPGAELRAALDDAVATHLVSDVPVGLLLSGGVDSTLLLALMSRHATGDVQTFSIGFGDRQADELAHARRVATRFGAAHHELLVDGDASRFLPEIVRHTQEPFADPAAVPTYAVSKLASEHVKVALSGDGGDELFVGYTTFRGVETARLAQRLPHAARRALAARHPLPTRPRGLAEAAGRWDRRIRAAAAAPLAAYRQKVGLLVDDQARSLLTDTALERLASSSGFAKVDAAFASDPRSPLAGALAASRDVGLPGNMLIKVDRMSMAHSLEVRVPLLDHVLAELVLRLPHAQLFPHWRLKGLLKDSVAGIVPREVLSRPKHGFDVPLGRWFGAELGRFASDVLLDETTRRRGLFAPDALERALAGLRAARPSELARPVWALLVLELWFRECLDGGSA